jgi:Uma2 family endonuclease
VFQPGEDSTIEYFAWEEEQLCRHEYINGNVYAMSGGSQNHSRVALKFAALLDNHLPGGACRVFKSDCRVMDGGKSSIIGLAMWWNCNQ